MTTVAIVQARMSSSRFPGKMLASLGGVPLAVFVCHRVAAARRVDKVVLATSTDPSDDALANAVEAANVPVYRGALDDVLGRFFGAAKAHGASTVVRITGDCPLTDAGVLDEMLERFAKGDLDYYSNISPPTFPDGLDLEIMTIGALETAAAAAATGHQREHVTPFLRDHPELFRAANHESRVGPHADLHWSVDGPGDLEIVRELLGAAATSEPSLSDLLSALDRRPDLRARSTTKSRNEGAVKTYLAHLETEAPAPKITESDKWWARAQGLIPAGTQTLSKGPTQFVRGFAPKYLVRGKGSHVWDADGNEFIDYPMGLGPITLGHGHPAVVEAITKQVAEGTAFSLMHPLEVIVAERIRGMVPCAEMVRFGKNGSDATTACVRAARAKTGRRRIARCGYHGWQDWSIDRSYGIRARGVPEEVLAMTVPFPYNDLGALERVLSEEPCAAVILEPISVTPPAAGYLEGVRALATNHGAVLVFDEVITGFRYARGGAQEYFKVTPDLTSMGKGVANGLPLSIVAGKAEFMAPFEELFFSFTFGGETLALAAAMATLDVMEKEDYWAHAWKQGGALQRSYRELATRFNLSAVTHCGGMPPWTVVMFQDTGRWSALQLKTLFQQEMIRRGILFSGSQFISLAHSDEDIARTVTAYEAAMRTLRFALDSDVVDQVTLGAPIELVFRRA